MLWSIPVSSVILIIQVALWKLNSIAFVFCIRILIFDVWESQLHARWDLCPGLCSSSLLSTALPLDAQTLDVVFRVSLVVSDDVENLLRVDST